MSEIYSFGEWVRRRRRALDLTQAILAEQVGCAASMIRKIEADERRPSRQVADLLADALQVPESERDQFLRTARAELAPDQLVPPAEALPTLPAPTSLASAGNLPLALTSFIGRETEMAAIQELLAAHRLVTLIGPGGTGKTRLALEVATGVEASFAHGVWLVELASLADPDLVTHTVGVLFGLREDAGSAIQTTLIDFFRQREMLLVLDNCEHLVQACARLVETLLRACPRLRILATSREALRIAGEAVYRVPPLRLPDLHRPLLREAVAQTEAVRLFAERAQVALPGFHVTDANVAAVAQICLRLDGIPLAIELAAARVPMLRVEQIAARLDDRFRLLTGGSRTAVPRQQTLRTLIDWSYDLLSTPEQRMLQRLSVFAGGWSLDAAEAVGSDGDEGDVLNVLTALVEKSLVQVERASGHETRYRLLETIREYALERLRASGVLDDAQRRHASYFLTWIDTNQPYLRGIEQRTWLDELELEHDNLRAALQWSLSGGDAVLGARLAGRLAQWEHGDLSGFWVARGHIPEGQRWLELALDALGDQQPALQAWTMLHLESLCEHIMTTHSDDLLERIHALFTTLDDQTGIAQVLLRKAGRLWQKGELGEARVAAETSLQLFEGLGDRNGASMVWFRLAHIEQQDENIDRARTLLEQCLAFDREHLNSIGIAGNLVPLAGIAERMGAYDKAAKLLHESLTLSEQLGEHFQLTWPLHGLGWLALDDVDDGQAFQLLEHHIGEFRTKGFAPLLCVLLPVYGMLISTRGDLAQAGRVVHECVTLVQTTGHRRFLCNSVEASAMLAKQDGQPNLAARWLGAESVFIHDSTVQTFNRTHPSVERLLVDTRAALGPDAFEAAWQAGQHLSIEQVIDEILTWTTP